MSAIDDIFLRQISDKAKISIDNNDFKTLNDVNKMINLISKLDKIEI